MVVGLILSVLSVSFLFHFLFISFVCGTPCRITSRGGYTTATWWAFFVCVLVRY